MDLSGVFRLKKKLQIQVPSLSDEAYVLKSVVSYACDCYNCKSYCRKGLRCVLILIWDTHTHKRRNTISFHEMQFILSSSPG